jgi:hypothetical protein
MGWENGSSGWVGRQTPVSSVLRQVKNAALFFGSNGVPIEIDEYVEHGQDAHTTFRRAAHDTSFLRGVGVGEVGFKVGEVGGVEVGFVADDQEVFGVLFFGGVGEVE